MVAFPAIPTTYAGVNFRSRLEARWASFFDLVGWSWQYEPAIETGWWIPDFLLIGKHRPVKVEVKPIQWVSNDYCRITQQAAAAPELAKVRAYIRHRYHDDDGLKYDFDYEDILVLGAYPHTFGGEPDSANMMLGVFLCERWGQHPDIAYLAAGYPPRKLDFHADQGSFEYRMGGEGGDGGGYGDKHFLGANAGTVTRLWREAGNTVQWRP